MSDPVTETKKFPVGTHVIAADELDYPMDKRSRGVVADPAGHEKLHRFDRTVLVQWGLATFVWEYDYNLAVDAEAGS